VSRPLPVTLDLRPGQALDCYLEHLAEANGLTTAGLLSLVRGGGGASATRFLMLHPTGTTTRRLARVARLAPAAVAAATLAAYDGTALDLDGLDAEALSSFRGVAARGWVPGHGTQLCPPCLADTGIWQLAWRLPMVTVCLTHATYLLAVCPGCGRPFRDQRHCPLRRAGTHTHCGNPLGQGPTRQCRRELTALATVRADPGCVAGQGRRNRAITGGTVRVLGADVPGVGYLQALRHLTTVLLHLANQPGGFALAPWATGLAAEATARTGRRGPRWGMRPPTDPVLRSRALSSADDILTRPTVEDAAAAFVPWLQAVPRSASGSLGWLANRTVMTPTLTRIVMAARAPHRTLSHRLDTHLGLDAPMCRLPQVLPTAFYRAHLRGLFDSDPDTVAMFGSLCLARAHPHATTWGAAATALRLPADLGQRTARACSATLRVSILDYLAHLTALAQVLPDLNYPGIEASIRHGRTSTAWFQDWAPCRPHTHATSHPYALTWQWLHVAHGHISTSPSWGAPPTAKQRALYRQFATSLTDHQQQQLRSALWTKP